MRQPSLTAPHSPIGAGLSAIVVPWAVTGRAAGVWLEGLTRLNSEWTRFVSDRLAKDADVQHALTVCGHPFAAQRIYTEFLQEAVSDYAVEGTRISTLPFQSCSGTRVG